ncbi:MAG: hypothetical protein WAX77_11880 [Methylococcaceae bacterium]
MTGWHVTKNDITQWTKTNSRKAQDTLPLLIKKLILASCISKPEKIDFPFGDDVALTGWDGELKVKTDNRFIPSGESGWEIGTNEKFKDKADKDYKKRCDDSTPFNSTETTFVFVTSRLWTKRDEWIAEKKKDNKWLDIRVIDAYLLADWLEQCPAVHRWFAQLIGKRCPELWDVEQAWQTFSAITKKSLTSDFFLHERADIIQQINLNSNSIAYIKAESAKEAYGFILSLIQQDEIACSRCLIVNNQQAWDFVIEEHESLILIPNGFIPDNKGIASRTHTIIIPVDNNYSQLDAISLQRQSRLIKQDAIKKLNFDEFQTNEIYRDTKGYFEPLLRHKLLKPIDKTIPEWIKATPPKILFNLLFIAEWKSNNVKDQTILATLANSTYSEFEQQLVILSKAVNSPIRKIDNYWQIISKIDYWFLIKHQFDDCYAKQLETVIETVLTDITDNYSNLLKRGLSDSLALLSANAHHHEKLFNAIQSGLKKVLTHNPTIEFWLATDSYFQAIAETAPNVFLEAIETDLKNANSVLRYLFEQPINNYFTSPTVSYEEINYNNNLSTTRNNILWALEIISWNKDCLVRTILCLAKLVEIDNTKHNGKRPFEVLTDIFFGLSNNTFASYSERYTMLNGFLMRKHSEIALALANHGYSLHQDFINHRQFPPFAMFSNPKYQDWAEQVEKEINNFDEYLTYLGKISHDRMSRVFENTCQIIETRDYAKIVNCIESINTYDDAQQQTIFEKISAINSDSLSDQDRALLLTALRNEIEHCKNKFHAQQPEMIALREQLKILYRLFDFNDFIKSNQYLFDAYHPKIIDSTITLLNEWSEFEKLISQKRQEVIEEIYQNNGINGIEAILINCDKPDIVGLVIYHSQLKNALITTMLKWLDSEGNKKECAKSYIRTLGIYEIEHSLSLFKENHTWSSSQKVDYLLLLSLNEITITVIDNLPSTENTAYWSVVQNYNVSNNNYQLIPHIAKNLFINKRPVDALSSLTQSIHQKTIFNTLDNQLIADILIEVYKNFEQIDEHKKQLASSAISELIKLIQNQATLNKNLIKTIEWVYFNLGTVTPQYLIADITNNPESFVELNLWLYKKEKTEHLNDVQRKNLALQVYRFFNELNVLPASNGNAIDEQELLKWVNLARELLQTEIDNEFSDYIIGQYLAHSPIGNDGIWPHEAVRAVIEYLESESFEKAIFSGKYNLRGVTVRPAYGGGEQEYQLAKKYADDANAIQFTSPRTAKILRAFADDYKRQGKDENINLELAP